MNTSEKIDQYFNLVKNTLDSLDRVSILSVVKQIKFCQDNGGKIILFGNGGSAATASHVCGDFLKSLSYKREKRFQAICLNDNIPSLMAYANDVSYADVFIEPLKSFLHPADLVIAISGSGNSPNVVKALEFAKQKEVKTVAVCGYGGGKIKEIADFKLHAKVDDMEVTEDIHLCIFHCIKQILMKENLDLA